MHKKIVQEIEDRARTMSFRESLRGHEQYEHAIRCSASIVLQSRIDLDHLCSLNVSKFSPSQFERYSRLKRELIRNLTPDEELPCIH